MPSAWTDLQVGIRIGRAAVRDRFRRHTSSRREKALFGLLALLVVPGILVFVQQAYTVGTLTRDGVDAPVVAAARNLLVPSLLVLVVIAGLESIQQLGSDSVRSLLLTSASTRAIVIGKVISLLVSWLVLVGLGFVLVTAYAVGARSPLFVMSVFLWVIPLFLLVLLAGLALGYSLWLAVERLGLSEGTRQLLTAALYLVVVALMFVGGTFVGGASAGDGLIGAVPTGDPLILLGWYADLLFVGSPMTVQIGVETALAAGIVFAAVPLVFGFVVRLAPLYWYATPADSETAAESEQAAASPDTPSGAIGRRAGISARSPTVRVALGTIRSARRTPGQFVYLFYYLFPVAPVLAQQAIGNPGNLPIVAGASLVVLGIWFAGGVFCLNPLGSEGSMLSQIVLAERPAETFVHARLLAGSVLGVGLTTAGILALGATSGQVTPTIGAVGAVFVGLAAVASAGFALGLGSVLPKFEAVEIFESVETVAPSIVAALVHAVVSLVLLGAAVVTTLAVTAPQSPLSVGQQLAAVFAFLLVAVLLIDGSRRYGIARLRDYGRPVARTDRPFAVYLSLGMAALAFVLGQVIATATIIFVGIDASPELLFPVLFIVEYFGYAVVGIGFIYATHRGIAYLDLSRPSGRDVAIIAGGLIASLGVWAFASLVITGLELPAADHALFDAEDDGTATLLLMLVPLVLFVNGPVEEFLYRNVIQKYLAERFPVSVAIVIASGIFAIAHVPAYLTAGLGALAVTLSLLFAVSMLWGALYEWTGSLVVVSAVHGLYNATLLLVLYLQFS